tara:strand:+ start:26120 stop:26866 length:747 start_codon:yes stop_codon:yes gene_type:complete
MSLVSVIMPYYFKRSYLENSLNSVLNQSYKNLEIILVNDETNLETKKFLQTISKKDMRIKLINNGKNLGAGKSRNKAIEMSNGEYIAFCDCDDLWKKTKLEKQLTFMKNSNLDFTFTAYEIINEKNDIISNRDAKKVIEFKSLLKSCDIGLSTVIIKKKLLKEKELRFASLKTKEDYILWLKIAKRGTKLFGLNENLSYWRKVSNSLSSSSVQKIIDGYRVYRYYLNYSVIRSIIYLFILSVNFLLKK